MERQLFLGDAHNAFGSYPSALQRSLAQGQALRRSGGERATVTYSL